MSKEKKAVNMFERTEVDESIKCLGDVAQLTLLRLRAAIYVRGIYGDVIGIRNRQNTNMGERIEANERFIHCKTNWQPIVMFSDIDGVSYYDYEPDYLELPSLKRQMGLNTLLKCIENRDIKIDVLVIDSLSQISRDVEIVKEVCNKLIENQVIVFCLNTKEIFAMNSLVKQKLLENPFDTSE